MIAELERLLGQAHAEIELFKISILKTANGSWIKWLIDTGGFFQ